jgi:hypothetical protein
VIDYFKNNKLKIDYNLEIVNNKIYGEYIYSGQINDKGEQYGIGRKHSEVEIYEG